MKYDPYKIPIDKVILAMACSLLLGVALVFSFGVRPVLEQNYKLIEIVSKINKLDIVYYNLKTRRPMLNEKSNFNSS